MKSWNMRAWNTARAALYGAAIGVAAAAIKLFAPWQQTWQQAWTQPQHAMSAIVEEFVGAALAFALLCGLAAALRNFIARRLIDPDPH
jgi:hypothetical protein